MDFLQGLLRVELADLPFVVLALVLCFTIHEFAHAYSAYKFGDDTAYNEGRVTLNPIAHLDVLGFLLILIAGFGWAKPVPVRPGRFSNPKMMSVIVSAAGPLSNLLLGTVAIFAINIMDRTGLLYVGTPELASAIETFFLYLIFYNFLLFVFNLIPLPPLDGYRIVSEFLPFHIRYKLDQNAQWGMIIFLLMVFIPPLRANTIDPVLRMGQDLAMVIVRFVHLIL